MSLFFETHSVITLPMVDWRMFTHARIRRAACHRKRARLPFCGPPSDCCRTSASIRRPEKPRGPILLQDQRVDPSASDNHAVRSAAMNGELAVVDRLLEDDCVDAIAIRYSLPENSKRFECRERLTEICTALQESDLAWVTVDAARPWSTLPLHSKRNLVCAVKHFHGRRSQA